MPDGPGKEALAVLRQLEFTPEARKMSVLVMALAEEGPRCAPPLSLDTCVAHQFLPYHEFHP
jgi:hypothetical protein